MIAVDGRPMISYVIELALRVTSDVTVVVSPFNAGEICQIGGELLEYVVQPKPVGVMDALCRGARGHTEGTLVLMCDNWINQERALAAFSQLDETGSKYLAMALRHVETGPLPDLTCYSTQSKQFFRNPGRELNGDDVFAWVGPLYLPASAMIDLYRLREKSIEDLLTSVGDPIIWDIPSIDIGTRDNFDKVNTQ